MPWAAKGPLLHTLQLSLIAADCIQRTTMSSLKQCARTAVQHACRPCFQQLIISVCASAWLLTVAEQVHFAELLQTLANPVLW